jgi:hypothetical protein
MATITETNPEIRCAMLALQRQMRAALASRGKGSIAFKELNYGDGHFNVERWPRPAIYEFMDKSELNC